MIRTLGYGNECKESINKNELGGFVGRNTSRGESSRGNIIK